MTQPAPAPPAFHPARWLNNQPYLLLSLTSLFWAGNIVLARHVAGHVPPLTLSCVRWIGTFLILLPFAWPHLKQDWPMLRAHLPMMLFLSLVGFAYNNAISYALAIAVLSDRLRGQQGIVTPWPTDDPGLSRIERKELQTLLQQRGYPIGNIDGVLGAKTREAIADFQERAGLKRDGRAGQKVLQALKGR